MDSTGAAYVVGYTKSNTFRGVAENAENFHGLGQLFGSNNVFVAKLTADGKNLVYLTYIGGVGQDRGNDIVVANDKTALITGSTWSNNFYTTMNAWQGSYRGQGDTFVTRLNAQGSGAVYSTYLGAGGKDTADAITIDDDLRVYVAGETANSGAFGVIEGEDADWENPTHVGQTKSPDALVMRLTAAGDLDQLYFIGGSEHDYAQGIAVDTADTPNIYVTGATLPDNVEGGAGPLPDHGGCVPQNDGRVG